MGQRVAMVSGGLLRKTFQIDQRTFAEIKDVADSEGVSESVVIGRLVRYGLEQQRKLAAIAKAAG